MAEFIKEEQEADDQVEEKTTGRKRANVRGLGRNVVYVAIDPAGGGLSGSVQSENKVDIADDSDVPELVEAPQPMEASKLSEATFYKVVAPLLELSSTTLIGISTPEKNLLDGYPTIGTFANFKIPEDGLRSSKKIPEDDVDPDMPELEDAPFVDAPVHEQNLPEPLPQDAEDDMPPLEDVPPEQVAQEAHDRGLQDTVYRTLSGHFNENLYIQDIMQEYQQMLDAETLANILQ